MADALRLLVDELEEIPRVWGFPRIHVLKGDFSESGAEHDHSRHDAKTFPGCSTWTTARISRSYQEPCKMHSPKLYMPRRCLE